MKTINIGKAFRNAKKKPRRKKSRAVFRAAFELQVENTSWKQLLHNKATTSLQVTYLSMVLTVGGSHLKIVGFHISKLQDNK